MTFKIILMRYCLFILFSILFALPSSFGQSKRSPYRMDIRLDLPLVGLSGAGVGLTRFLQRRIDPLTPTEIANLSTDDITSFDISATRQWSTTAKTLSDIGAITAMAAPALLFLSPEIDRHELGTILLIGVETVFLTDFATNLTKTLTLRPRPYLYNQDITVPQDLLEDRRHRFAFFSGHTSFAAAASFATAQIYADYHPKSKYKPYIWAAAAALPAAVGYWRYKAGKHYPTDIITGYLVGAGIGLLVPYIHRKAKKLIKK